MRTLGTWVRRLLQTPLTIECPTMQILGRDHEPPVFTGPGRISAPTSSRMEFIVHAKPTNDGDAFARLKRAKENPDNIFDQFRLEVTDYLGHEWAGGWTEINVGEICNGVWRLSGEINSLVTGVSGDWVQPESSVELVYDAKLRLPMRNNMVTTVTRGGKEVLSSWAPGSHVLKVADTEVEFFHAAEREHIWATAKTSTQFRHPFAENWISEPLRLLLGQLVFPRLVARNKGDGSADIWLRRSPRRAADPLVASILGEDPLGAFDRFWPLYRDILTMIVNATDAEGHPNFQAHPLTSYYHEIADASVGSNWVLCMTLASAAEGVVNLLFPPSEREPVYPAADVKELRKHIEKWHGDKDLRARVLGSLDFANRTSLGRLLRRLSSQGTLDLQQVEAWDAVRNRVMHGVLVAPWVDSEMLQRIQQLASLVHRLSLAYIKKCAGDASSDEGNV